MVLQGVLARKCQCRMAKRKKTELQRLSYGVSSHVPSCEATLGQWVLWELVNVEIKHSGDFLRQEWRVVDRYAAQDSCFKRLGLNIEKLLRTATSPYFA